MRPVQYKYGGSQESQSFLTFGKLYRIMRRSLSGVYGSMIERLKEKINEKMLPNCMIKNFFNLDLQ